MPWPTDDLETTEFEDATRSPAAARPMLLRLIQRVQEIIAARGAPGGVAPLNATSQVEVGNLNLASNEQIASSTGGGLLTASHVAAISDTVIGRLVGYEEIRIDTVGKTPPAGAARALLELSGGGGGGGSGGAGSPPPRQGAPGEQSAVVLATGVSIVARGGAGGHGGEGNTSFGGYHAYPFSGAPGGGGGNDQQDRETGKNGQAGELKRVFLDVNSFPINISLGGGGAGDFGHGNGGNGAAGYCLITWYS